MATGLGAALLAFAALADDAEGTGTGGPQDLPVPAVESEEPAPREALTPEQAALDERLRERVQERWNAMIERDLIKAYEYETPAYRETHTPTDYARSFGALVAWHVATVKDVRYDAPHEAVVKLTLDVSFPVGGEEVRTTVPLDDHWVYLEDEWWRVDVDRPLGKVPESKPSPSE
jgi:hypothetical protein